MSNTKQFKTLLDRPMSTNHIKNFDKMTVELSPFMTEFEIDQCVSFMHTLDTTKYDINPSPTDCQTQLEIMLGKDRFLEICKKWNEKNQKWLTVFGILKYKHKIDGTYWDGLDPEDNPDDYEKTYV